MCSWIHSRFVDQTSALFNFLLQYVNLRSNLSFLHKKDFKSFKYPNFQPFARAALCNFQLRLKSGSSIIDRHTLALILPGQLTRSVAFVYTSCRPVWLSFSHILKMARMTSRHWPQQHFELLSFLAHPTMHNLLQVIVWSNQTFVGPGHTQIRAVE